MSLADRSFDSDGNCVKSELPQNQGTYTKELS